MKRVSTFLPELILFACITIICLIWYRPGLILATGETGIPFYSLARSAALAEHSWQEHVLGNPTGFVSLSYPLYWSLLHASRIIPVSILQIILFWLLMATGALSTMQFITHPHSKLSRTATGLFYLSNLIVLSQVWNRFQYAYMFFYSLLPVALLLYTRAIQQHKWQYLIYVNAVTFLYVLTFASLPLLILFWGIIFTWSIAAIILKVTTLKTSIIYFLGFFCLWCCTNLWWLIPYAITISTNSYITQVAHTSAGNDRSFETLSRDLGNMSNVFRLWDTNFFKMMDGVWWGIYNNPILQIISWIIPFIVFMPLLMKKKNGIIYLILGITLILIFFIKGSSPPFGELFKFAFNHIRILEAFRNPFEKISLALPFFYAVLFGISIQHLSNTTREYTYFKLLPPILTIVCTVAITFPLWNRWVFLSKYPPTNQHEIGYYVQVPDYYRELDTFLGDTTYRTIAFPLEGEGITLAWRYGYSGVDPTNNLLSTPSISLNTPIQFLEPIAGHLEKLLLTYPNVFPYAMHMLNAPYVINRNDVDYLARDMTPPQEIKAVIEQNGILTKQQTFGKLEVYSKGSPNDYPKIYPANSIVTISPNEENIISDVLPFISYQKNTVILPKNLPEDIKSDFIQQDVITSTIHTRTDQITEKEMSYLPIPKPEISKENALIELPFANTLPHERLYPLVRLRENISLANKEWSDQNYLKLRYSGKRLVEIFRMSEQSVDESYISKTANEYLQSLEELDTSYVYYFQEVIGELVRQQHVLNLMQEKWQLLDKQPALIKSYEFLDTVFSKGLPLKDGQNVEVIQNYYELNIPNTSTYQLIFDEKRKKSVFVEGQISINGENTTLAELRSRPRILTAGINSIELKDTSQQTQDILTRNVLAISDNESYIPRQMAQISFIKINPAKYEVAVQGASDPFILVFAESYHPLWEARIQNQKIDDNYHLRANSYANAWYITQTGNYTINLDFALENTYSTTKHISTFTAVISLLCLVVYSLFRIGKRNQAR